MQPIIETKNLTHIYSAGTPFQHMALDSVDFHAYPGEYLGIIGHTGAGKSTLIRLLMRFYDADEGTVYVDGRDVRTYDKRALREKFGAAFQSDVIFAESIRDNISLGRPLTDEELLRAAEDARLFLKTRLTRPDGRLYLRWLDREPAVEGKVNNPVRLAKERLEKMEEVYTEEDIKKICSIIEEAEKEFDFFMGSEYFTSLATHITISVFRLRHGHQIQKEFLPPNEEFPQQEMNTAAFIARRLEETFQVHLPDSERTYICIHLMGYNAFQAQMEEEQKAPENIELLALHLIEAVDAELGGRFSSDRVLFFGLLTHLQNSLYQQKENPGARTRHSIQLPESCRELYDSVKKQAPLYQRLGGVFPDQQELTSLTLHFALAQDRTTSKWRALLVSNAGVIIQQSQRKFLQECLPQIKIVDICSPYQFSVYPDSSYDFIISMTPLSGAVKPVADVSHMTKAQRVQMIEEFLFEKMDNRGSL